MNVLLTQGSAYECTAATLLHCYIYKQLWQIYRFRDLRGNGPEPARLKFSMATRVWQHI